MVKDRIVAGALIGIFADVIKLLVNYLAYLFGYTNVVFWQIVAAHFLQKGELSKPIALLIGGAADFTITAVLGIIFLYVAEYTGKSFLPVKGLGFGMIVWVGLFGTHLGQSVQGRITQDGTAILVTLVAHIIFGLSLAFFTWLYYRYALRKGLRRHI